MGKVIGFICVRLINCYGCTWDCVQCFGFLGENITSHTCGRAGGRRYNGAATLACVRRKVNTAALAKLFVSTANAVSMQIELPSAGSRAAVLLPAVLQLNRIPRIQRTYITVHSFIISSASGRSHYIRNQHTQTHTQERVAGALTSGNENPIKLFPGAELFWLMAAACCAQICTLLFIGHIRVCVRVLTSVRERMRIHVFTICANDVYRHSG